MTPLTGACSCGNIQIEASISFLPESFALRECDCEFCQSRGIEYFSDAAGTLRIRLERSAQTQILRQGSRTAEFLTCGHCDAVAAVFYRENSQTWASLNARLLKEHPRFAPTVVVSPQTLSATEKISRWKTLWFSQIFIEGSCD